MVIIIKVFLKVWNYFGLGGKIKHYMTPKRRTVEQILTDLNRGLPANTWVLVPTSYYLSATTVNAMGNVNLLPNGMVLTLFINNETGEIKTYLTKWIQGVPESIYL